MNQPTKQSTRTTVLNALKRNERRILITTVIATSATSVVMGVNVSKCNAFLREQGLLEQFYNITPKP